MSRFRLTARAIPTIGLLILLEPFGGEPLQAQQDRLDKTPLKPYQMRVPEMTRAEASVGVDFRAFGRYGYGQYQPISPCGFVGIKCVPSRAKVMAYPGPTPVTIPPWFDLVSPTPGNSQYAQDAAPFHQDVISQFKSTRPEDEAAIALASSRGDEYVLQGEFTRALDQYRQASRLGEDQVDLRFKMMILLAEAGLYREAACELRSGLSLDPNWLDKGVSLSEFFGPGKEELIRRVIDSTASWARKDLNDPERLLLMGSLLMLNGELKKASVVLRSLGQSSEADTQIQAVFDSLRQRQLGGACSRDALSSRLLEHLRNAESDRLGRFQGSVGACPDVD